MIREILNINEKINDAVWGCVVLIFLLAGGLYFTAITGGVQIKKFGYAMKTVLGKITFGGGKEKRGAVTQFQAVATALAGTLGTGSIIGVGQAIAMGGCGAVLWMWAASVFGMIIKYAEIVLAVKFRERSGTGEWLGGPMYYIKNGMGKKMKWLAGLFCIFAVFSSFGIGNMAQSNTVAGALAETAAEFIPDMGRHVLMTKTAVGVVLALLTAVTIFGGMKRTGRICELLVPVMSMAYLVLAAVVIADNGDKLPAAFREIFVSAFGIRPVAGAASGISLRYAVSWGLRRSASSNEAGLGTAAIAHAGADVSEPAEQGMFGIFEVFVDTMLICTVTALMIIVSGAEPNPGEITGAEIIISAFAASFGRKAASLFMTVIMFLFAFSTLIGWSLYGAKCAGFVFGAKAERAYRGMFVVLTALGAAIPAESVWSMADTFNGLMAVPNFIALFALSGTVASVTDKYFKRKKKNENVLQKRGWIYQG